MAAVAAAWLVAAGWALAAAEPTAPAVDRAGNRLEPLIEAAPAEAAEEPSRGELRCTADRALCAQLRRGAEAWRLHVFEGGPAAADEGRVVAVADPEGDASHALWPWVVREVDGAVLLGVERRRSTGFAGGGASRSDLELVRVEPGGAAAAAVLHLPTGTGLSIRSCFTEADRRRRAGACLSELGFEGRLTLDRETPAGRPRLRYETEAQSYPGVGARDDQSRRRLRRRDLVRARDPVCSYRRVFVWDQAAGRYVPDRPLPDCSDYLDF